MASTYLTRTPSSDGNQKTWTLSVWFKGGSLTDGMFFTYTGTSSARSEISLGNINKLYVAWNPTGSGWYYASTSQTRQLRDPNAWYHLVIGVDTTQATASNRVKIYINGEQAGSELIDTYPTQNQDTGYNKSGYSHQIGRYAHASNNYFDGAMSHFHWIDGTQYDASAFGSTDATTGEWKINTSPSVTYGTNGFFILKDGNSVTDQSGNGNNFTVGGGTLTKTEDNPSNVFATLNALDNYYANATLSNGNTTVATNASNETYITSTLAVSTGKYYWEVEYDAGSDNSFIGIIDRVSDSTSFQAYIDATNGISYKKNGSIYTNGGNMSGVNIGTYTTGDIISVAMDLDNNKLYFGKNGSWLNSGVPTSGSTGTGAFSINSSPKDGVYYAQVGDDNTGSQTLKCNFGNGYFGTTAVTSAGTNASGNGIFEYDVPTGYTALSTKGLNS